MENSSTPVTPERSNELKEVNYGALLNIALHRANRAVEEMVRIFLLNYRTIRHDRVELFQLASKAGVLIDLGEIYDGIHPPAHLTPAYDELTRVLGTYSRLAIMFRNFIWSGSEDDYENLAAAMNALIHESVFDMRNIDHYQQWELQNMFTAFISSHRAMSRGVSEVYGECLTNPKHKWRNLMTFHDMERFETERH